MQEEKLENAGDLEKSIKTVRLPVALGELTGLRQFSDFIFKRCYNPPLCVLSFVYGNRYKIHRKRLYEKFNARI